MQHGGKGITLFTISGDVCDAASLTARAISDGEAAEIVAVTDDADMFWFDRATRKLLEGVAK